MFGNPFSSPNTAFSRNATQQRRTRYHCYQCTREFLLEVPLENSWCPQCTFCGSSFVEEESSQLEQLAQPWLFDEETRTLSSSWSGWGREHTITSLFEEDLPVAPSIGPSRYHPRYSTRRDNAYAQNLRTTNRNTANASNVSQNPSTWQQVLDRFLDVFSRWRSSLGEQTTSRRPPASAHTTTTASSSSFSTEPTRSFATENVNSFRTRAVPSSNGRRVRRRTGENEATHLPAEEIWEREFAFLYRQLLSAQNDPEEYVRMQTLLSSMLDCLLEMYAPKSNPTCKSFLDSLEGQVLTEQQAKEAESCAICWEEFKPNTVVVFLPCSHLFCKNCICTWLKENSSCPTCRYQLPVDEREEWEIV
jgi:hypothetical protein